MQRSSTNMHDQFVKIQHPDCWEDFIYSGKITAACLSMLKKEVRSGDKTATFLDGLAEEYFRDNKTEPVFKGYGGFPASVCISVNKELVHGIPKDKVIEQGDLVSFDTGCTFNRAITDSAFTMRLGEENDPLVLATHKSLMDAIASCAVGVRIGEIGNAIHNSARKSGFKIIEQYTGHGISLDQVHSDPQILNKSEPNEGVRLQEGMVIAIEPLLIGSNSSTRTRVSEDKWTVVAEDICAHFEHSVLIRASGNIVLTRRQDEDSV